MVENDSIYMVSIDYSAFIIREAKKYLPLRKILFNKKKGFVSFAKKLKPRLKAHFKSATASHGEYSRALPATSLQACQSKKLLFLSGQSRLFLVRNNESFS